MPDGGVGPTQRGAAQRAMFLTFHRTQYEQHQDRLLTSGLCGCAFCNDYRQEREIQDLERKLRLPDA